MVSAAGSFLKRFQLEYLLGALKDVFTRFPLSSLCCTAGLALSVLEQHDIKPLYDDQLARTLLFLGYGLVLFTALRLCAEGARLSRAAQTALQAGGFALLAALCFLPAHFSATHLFVGASFALSMLFAPYILRPATEDSVWFYNYTNGISLIVAGLSTFVLCLGLSAIIGSMDYLLYDMKLSGKIYGDIWIFGGTFFGPVAFLHQLCRQFDFEKSECAVPKGVSFIANYLAVPLVLVYTWVLYVYFLKIAVQWELPKGNLAYMVMGFGSAGSAVRLAVFPLREQGTKLLQQFYKFFYWLLLVPLFLLAIGLYTRLAAYGVTEDRYAIGLGLAWLTLLTVWNIAKPRLAQLIHAPMVLAALFLACAAGPWGVVAVSDASQAARLERLLGEAGVFHDGKIEKTAKEVPFALRKQISSQLEYFSGAREAAIEPLVAPFRAAVTAKYKSSMAGCTDFMNCWGEGEMTRRLMEAWGMAYVSPWENEEDTLLDFHTVESYTMMDGLVRAAPYEYILKFYEFPNGNSPPGAKDRDYVYKEQGKTRLSVRLSATPGGDFSVALADGRKAVFPLQPLALALHGENIRLVPENQADRMVLNSRAGGFKAQLRISSLRFRQQGKQLSFESLSGLLLFSP